MRNNRFEEKLKKLRMPLPSGSFKENLKETLKSELRSHAPVSQPAGLNRFAFVNIILIILIFFLLILQSFPMQISKSETSAKKEQIAWNGIAQIYNDGNPYLTSTSQSSAEESLSSMKKNYKEVGL